MTELTANTQEVLDMNNHNSEIPVQKIMLDIYLNEIFPAFSYEQVGIEGGKTVYYDCRFNRSEFFHTAGGERCEKIQFGGLDPNDIVVVGYSAEKC